MKKKSGFTLVEVLITTAILVGALAGILSLVTYSYSMVETSRNSSQALNIAQRRLEEIRNRPFDEIITLHNNTFVEQDPNGLNFNGTISVVPLRQNYLDSVTINLSWNQGERQISQSYTAAIADETE